MRFRNFPGFDNYRQRSVNFLAAPIARFILRQNEKGRHHL